MTSALEEPERLAVAFVHVLRCAGLDVAAGSTILYAEALAAVGLGAASPVYWAGRATLVQRPEDAPIYSACFDAFWRGRGAPLAAVVPTEERREAAAADSADDDTADQPTEEVPSSLLELRYSRAEVLREKDFAACSPEELAEAYRLMARLEWSGARRLSRRHRPTRRRGGQPDLRRTLRRALRTGGEPLERRWLGRRERSRRTVLLCDVSGSMAPYARALLRFLHAAVAARREVEAFTIGTRLTRVTRSLAVRDPDMALVQVACAVPDFSGGTRLGDALREFNDRWGMRGLARGAAVVVLSDGWDRGDPSVVDQEMARLARVAYEVVWVNPLKATPGYAPLARGMAAALPYVDHFMEGHSLASLESLAGILAGTRESRRRSGTARRPMRRETVRKPR
jgi:uncharacterized protein with von Willebrand factor type A (vWA) domain